MITGRDCVYSVVVVSYTRHVAYYHRYAVREDRSLIQLRYTAIIVLQPRLPSVIPAGVPWQLMNKANSGVMSPFRNAFSKLFDGLSLPPSLHVSASAQVTKPRRAPLTMGYQNALPFGMKAMVEKFMNLWVILLRIAISDFANIAK